MGFSDPKRAQRLLSIYNERFNRIRPRTYNGEHLLFEGLNQQFTLRPHQKMLWRELLKQDVL